MLSAWDTFKAIVKWTLLAAVVGWGCVWAFGKLSKMGEVSPSRDGKVRDAQEVMKPPPRKDRGW